MPTDNKKETGEQNRAKLLMDLIKSNPYLKGAAKSAEEQGFQDFLQSSQQQGGLASMDKFNQILRQQMAEQLPNQEGSIGIQQPKSMFSRENVVQEPNGKINYQQPGFISRVGSNVLGTQTNPLDVLNSIVKNKYLNELSSNKEIKGLSGLSPEQQVQAYSLARKIGGVRGAEKVLPSIIENVKQGKNIDQIEDELRYSGQSAEFGGNMRFAAQQIMAGKSSSDKQSTFDDLDDLSNDSEAQKDYLKRISVKNAPVSQQEQVMGKERTLEFLGEIKNDLQELEKSGIPTGFFSGNTENLLAKIGQVKEPRLREAATKIATAMIKYRRDMTGVQFGEKEAREYKVIFPGINKVGAFNMANISALEDTFGGDLNKFYSQSMGKKNYDKLFGSDKPKSRVNTNKNEPQQTQNDDSVILNRLGLDPNKFEIVR